MELTQHDVDAIARIVDRCSPGGSDNPRGIRFALAKAEQQFSQAFERLELLEPELEALRLEFDTWVSEAERLGLEGEETY